jgi:hypothetical protein
MVAALVYLYRKALVDGGLHKSDEDFWTDRLSIVTPHRAWMVTIRNLRVDAAGIPVDSPPFLDPVDRVQGQERDLIIASYAVSARDFVRELVNSDAQVARDAAHLQPFVGNYCSSVYTPIELKFIDNGVLTQLGCRLRGRT